MKQIVLQIFIFLIAQAALQSQTALYTREETIYMSKVDSSIYIYRYPVFSGMENKESQARLNKQIHDMILPDTAVLDKLEKLEGMPPAYLHGKQEIDVAVTYANHLIVCIETSILVTAPDIIGEAGDRYFNTLSIAGGNEYRLQDFFTDNLYPLILEKYRAMKGMAEIEQRELMKHLVGFGFVADENCVGCFTLEIIINTLYAQSGPMPVELSFDEIRPYLKSTAPLEL